MNPFRQILEDTASLARDVRRGMDHLLWRFTWWKRRRGAQAGRALSEAENVRRSVTAASKMCRECRALIPASASSCPECGARTTHIRSGGIGRALAHLLPVEPSVSMLLVTVYFLIFITGLVLSMRMDAPGPEARGPFQSLMSIDFRALVMTGANYAPLSGGPEPWRLLTATFLHGGALHLLFNAWALMVVGPLIEHLYGARKMFVLTLLTGVAGNVLSLWWHGPGWRQVGASGAIFGLIGVAAVYGFRRGDAVGEGLRRHMTEWIVYGLVMGLFMRADNAAHIGGLIAGAAAAFVVGDADLRRGGVAERLWSLLAYLGVFAVAGAFALIAVRWAGAA